MSSLNASEKAIADYFGAHGLEHHWIPRTNAPTPDLKVFVDPRPVIVEIKEFNRSEKLRIGGYCPVPFVRHKIRQSWRQFEHYSDHTCCLMLYNAGSFTVSLQPELILCAMFGEYFETIDPVRYRFSGIAAMRPDRNTYISAVAGLFPLRVHRNCLEAGRMVFQLTQGYARELTDDQVLHVHRETTRYVGEIEQVMRAVVVENPFAPQKLPETLFRGPFDERWHRGNDDLVRLKYSGERVAEMRRLLPEYARKMMGLW
jgi:hypothetical protein